MNSFLGYSSVTTANNNSTPPPFVQVPASLLDAFIPGYSTISSLLLETFGFDITLLVSISFFIFALIKSVSFLESRFVDLVVRFGTCHVLIASDVDTYTFFMDWLGDRGVGNTSRSLIALPPSRKKGFEHIPGVDPHQGFLPAEGEYGTYRKAMKPQRYEPSLGVSEYFWYKGNLFLWYRMRERRRLTDAGMDMATTLIEGRLYCLSRTTEPIKRLIADASALYHKKSASRTTIRRPAPRQQRSDGNPWRTVARRPSRPLETVVLESKEKSRVLSDITEYMRPDSRKWYAERGIPYRRGYLFHGPPGTGKTSLSFAIAGYFGLDVFCVSLAEPTITEEDLVMLFDELPEQCLVLLEDVDSAGLVVRDGQARGTSATLDTEGVNSSRVTLSGLLNVIDGVASQEGRVLIMTTNHIKSLDSALLRPGRVDIRVHLGLATKKHAEEMFMQAFADVSQKTTVNLEKAKEVETLEEMAHAFAAEIPERVLSPADIQGFLMLWKKSARSAVENVGVWVKESVATGVETR